MHQDISEEQDAVQEGTHRDVMEVSELTTSDTLDSSAITEDDGVEEKNESLAVGSAESTKHSFEERAL